MERKGAIVIEMSEEDFQISEMSLPEKITTVRVQTQTELARQTICRLVDALNSATTRDALDLYLALISAKHLELGKVLSKIDDDYINFTGEDG